MDVTYARMNKKKLILLGGAPGVGKSTVLRLLEKRLPLSAVVDADDVWRVSGDIAVPENRGLAIANVVSVMRGYFEAGCETGILSWVFARSELYNPVIGSLEDVVDSVRQVYLVASADVLRRRLSERWQRSSKAQGRVSDPEAGLETKVDYAMSRLELINALPFAKINTSSLSPEQVAHELVSHVRQCQ